MRGGEKEKAFVCVCVCVCLQCVNKETWVKLTGLVIRKVDETGRETRRERERIAAYARTF